MARSRFAAPSSPNGRRSGAPPHSRQQESGQEPAQEPPEAFGVCQAAPVPPLLQIRIQSVTAPADRLRMQARDLRQQFHPAMPQPLGTIACGESQPCFEPAAAAVLRLFGRSCLLIPDIHDAWVHDRYPTLDGAVVFSGLQRTSKLKTCRLELPNESKVMCVRSTPADAPKLPLLLMSRESDARWYAELDFPAHTLSHMVQPSEFADRFKHGRDDLLTVLIMLCASGLADHHPQQEHPCRVRLRRRQFPSVVRPAETFARQHRLTCRRDVHRVARTRTLGAHRQAAPCRHSHVLRLSRLRRNA